MCVAVPARIESINADFMGIVNADGVKREISLLLLPDAVVGNYVIVHAGFGIHIIDEEEAKKSIELLKEMAAMVEEAEAPVSGDS